MKAKQLVTLHEWNAYQQVMQEKKLVEKEHEVLFYPKLSILTNNENIIERFGYETRVTFLVTRKPRDRIKLFPILAVDVFDNVQELQELEEAPKSKAFKSKRQFLEDLRISYVAYAVEGEKLYKHDKFSLDCERHFELESGAFNFFQYRAVMSFNIGPKSIPGGERFSILHETSLDALVSIGQRPREELIEKVNHSLTKRSEKTGEYIKLVNKNFFLNTSIDASFCVEIPNGIPLFGIECDGGDHEKPKNKGKDYAKNILFRLLGLPLIRVKSKFYRVDDKDIDLKDKINNEVARHITKELLKEEIYIRMISEFLRNEALKLEQHTQTGSNITKLTEKMVNYLSRREAWHRTRAEQEKDRADINEYLLKSDPSAGYLYQENKKIERDKQKTNEYDYKYRFGVKVEEEFVEGSKGIKYVAKIKAEDHHKRAGVKASVYTAGPYLIEDATGRFDLKPIVRNVLQTDVREWLNNYFLSGDPSLKTKIAKANKQHEWNRSTHRELVSEYLNTRYLPSIEAAFFPTKDEEGKATKSPPEVLSEIILELNNMPFLVEQKKRDAVIDDLKRVHHKLFEQGQASHFFEASDFGEISGLRMLLISWSFNKKPYFVDLLDDPAKLRSVLDEVDPLRLKETLEKKP